MKKLHTFLHLCLSVAVMLATLAPSAVLANPAAPNPPANLSQLTNDGRTVLAVGDTIVEHALQIKASLTDPDRADTVTMELEVRQLAEPFTGTPTHVALGVPTVAGDPTSVQVAVTVPQDGGYHWRARTRDASGALSEWQSFPSPSTNPDNQADFIVDTLPPKPPSDFTAKADWRRNILSWTNPTDADFDRVEIFRSTVGGQIGSKITTVTGTSFTDTNLEDGVSYYYALKALDKIGRPSEATNQVLAVTEIRVDETDTSTPGFSQTGSWNTVASTGQFNNFKWATGYSGAKATYRPTINYTAEYEIYVSWVVAPQAVPGAQATNAPYKVTTASRNESFLLDQSAKADGSRETNTWSGWKLLGTFQLDKGTGSTIELTASANGFVVADASRFVYLRPVAPANPVLKDRPNDRGNALELSWRPSVSETVARYRVYRTQRPGSYDFSSRLAEVTDTLFIDQTVVPGATYHYVVTAFDGKTESAPSLEVSGASVTEIFPEAPANLAIVVSDNQATLSWSKVEQAAAYVVRYRKTADTTFSSLLIDGKEVTTTAIAGLSPDTEYEFTVAARDSSGNLSSFLAQLKRTLTVKVAVEVAKGKTVEEAEAAVKAEEAKPAVKPQEAKVKAEEEKAQAAPSEAAKPRIPRRLAVAIVIILVAIGAGLIGYYGLEWLGREKQPPTGGPKPPRKNGRW